MVDMCGLVEVVPDQPMGKAIGFTDDKFVGLVLIYNNHTVYINYIAAKNRNCGDTTSFIRGLLEMNFKVKVSSVISDEMEHICRKLGFKKVFERHPYFNNEVFDMWVSSP